MEAKKIRTGGRWYCTIVKDLPAHVNYKTLSSAILEKTGITILKQKEML